MIKMLQTVKPYDYEGTHLLRYVPRVSHMVPAAPVRGTGQACSSLYRCFSMPPPPCTWGAGELGFPPVSEGLALLASTLPLHRASRRRCSRQWGSQLRESATPYLSLCSAATLSFLWESIFSSLTVVSQTWKTFFCSKLAQSFLTPLSRSLTY